MDDRFRRWREYLTGDDIALADRLAGRAEAERASGEVVCPPQEDIFRALEMTAPEDVRAVIIGQDPYHTPGAANGLAFSVPPGVKIPPSLRNIFRELNSDTGCPIPESGDLSPWARHGVLLLNTSLTVRAGQPGSHIGWGWQRFVSSVLRVCADLPQPVVFLLWGGHARAMAAGLLAGRENKAAVCSSHPSPLGAGKGSGAVPAFTGSRPFSAANRLLRSMGAEPVDWSLGAPRGGAAVK